MNALIDISGVRLKTERLLLREWSMDDLSDLFEYAKVDGVGQMAGWPPHRNIEESKTILARFIAGKRTFCIEYDGKAIGSVGIEKYKEEVFPEYQEKKGREIGYVLSKDYWGRGFMTESVKAVIAYCFDVLDLDFLACGHFLHNQRSWRVQEKCGFVHRKLIKYETVLGTIEDDWQSILENPHRR